MKSIKAVEARITEEACLDEVMRLQFGDPPCPACGEGRGYERAPKHRSFACRACGFKVFPCLGTPFAKAQPPLRDWFLAIYAAADDDKVTVRGLKGELGVAPRLAEQLADGIASLKEHPAETAKGQDWIDAVRTFVEDAPHDPRATATSVRAGRSGAAKEPEAATAPRRRGHIDRWGYVGIAGIVGLALVGAGIGWLLVPDVPEEDSEIVQATAILTLANDKPVLIVSQEVADQLYDVQDIEAEPSTSSAMPSIRLAPPPSETKGTNVAEAKPLAAPSIKLAPSVGQSLLRGDFSAVKGKGGEQRPELAAYSALARELENRGARDPNEVLAFGPIKIRRYLVDKVYAAAIKTKMDPVLLMAIADKESSFATEVQAQTSSATGLFQFIEKTWLGVVRDFGPTYGLDKEARSIDPGPLAAAERVRILDLRRDAYFSAVFAAEMLLRDSNRIAKRVGRPLTGGEIYLVHFLGPDGAEKLIARVQAAPEAAASDLLPKPAEANKTIFYTTGTDGAAKKVSVSELKEKFDTMILVRTQRYRNVHDVTVGTASAKETKRR